MTQFDTDTDPDDDEVDEGTGLVKDLRKQLRESNKTVKELREAVEANSSASRRVAFLDAEIPDTAQTRFFREKYEGEYTREAIRAAASEYGFIQDDDHTEALDEVSAQSDAALGADGPTAIGDQSEMEAAMDKAAREAPHGQESRAIADVVARYTRKV